MSRECDYDLNVYQHEIAQEDADTGEMVYDYAGPWYIDIYDVYGSGHQHVAGPYELTKQEARLLDLGHGYFDEGDCWYGLEGFLKDYEDYISSRLMDIFTSLPKHAEEVLF
jgi:hypothetical protein